MTLNLTSHFVMNGHIFVVGIDDKNELQKPIIKKIIKNINYKKSKPILIPQK